ncbi:hypothetical protein Tco_0418079 [Tanacetum coccineum]
MKIVTVLKNDFKKEESRNIDREIALENKIKLLDNIVYKRHQSTQTVCMLTKPKFFYDHSTKQALGFQNPFYLKKAQQLEPKLYDGNVNQNTYAIVIPDSEETLMLAKESRSKMLLKQQDPMVLEKKNSMNSSDPSSSCTPTKVEVPKELPKEEMEQETAQNTTTTKLPILKQGEYDMWRLRIEQYFQIQDYALWDVIENGNSFKAAAQTITNAEGTSTTLVPGPVTTKEKA